MSLSGQLSFNFNDEEKPGSIRLSELTGRITALVHRNPGIQNVWVTGEVSDFMTRGRHSYMELIEKDSMGKTVAKVRAMIWNSAAMIAGFYAETGQEFKSGIKVLVNVNTTMHPVFGLALNITEIDASYTLGDAERIRKEILDKLKANGIFDSNRNLSWPELPLRIAVISAQQAAGYQDFCNHLFVKGLNFKFETTFFEAVMQGERTVPTVIAAFNNIQAQIEKFDCVVLIRGGGATSELRSFDNYELARTIALFPLPVIVGIGHERDRTVLDEIANIRVKTPTAAADAIIERCIEQYNCLFILSQKLADCVRNRVDDEEMHLSYMANTLLATSPNVVVLAKNRLDRSLLILQNISSSRLTPERHTLERHKERLALLCQSILKSREERIKSLASLLEAYSPMAVLKRGYTITKLGESTLKSSVDINPGTEITTLFYDGEIKSKTI